MQHPPVAAKGARVTANRLSSSISRILVAAFAIILLFFALSLPNLISLSFSIPSLIATITPSSSSNLTSTSSFPLSFSLALNFPTTSRRQDETESPYPTPVLHLSPLPISALVAKTTVRSFFADAPYPSPNAASPPDFVVVARRAGVPKLTLCTFRGACVAANGSLLVHPRLAAHAARITALCGRVDLAYFDRFNETHRTAGTHLLGARPLRYHIPHFMTDAVSAQVASDVVFRNGTDSIDIIPPDATNSTQEVERTALYVEERVLNFDVSSWVPRAASLLHGPPVLIAASSMFDSSAMNYSCFAAVTTLPRAHPRGNYSALLSRAPAFNAAGGRVAMWRNGVCRPNVLLMDRVAIHGGRYHGRNLHAAGDVKRMIVENSSKVIRPLVRHVYFENASLSAQAAVVRRAHVLVGVHGAGLTNVVFAATGTMLLELYPYTYYPGLFEEFARWYGLRYDFVVAAPDDAVFWTCMRARGVDKREGVQKFKEVWRREHEERGNKSRNSDILVWSSPKFRSWDQSAARACAHMQRLRFDPAALARMVWTHIDRVCAENKTKR